MMMRAVHTTPLLTGFVLAALMVPLRAQPAQGNACEQITKACERAGFAFGGVNAGIGRDVDCIQPIMAGKPQRPQAKHPLPRIDPKLVAACKASNPKFGQAQPAAPEAEAPQGDACEQITKACERAGFVLGGVNKGIGRDVDCIQPIMEGKPQRPQATRPLPPVDPQLISACKASNPTFGQAPVGPSSPAAAPAAAPAMAPAPGGGKYLDAKFCSDTLNLNPGSTFDNGSCQLWKLVPDASGWSRLQLKHNGKFLDAKFCRDDLNMNPGSNFDNGSCQLWKLVPVGGGWSRLQIKRNGKFLDADQCTDNVKLSELSTFADGACQLWRLVPDEGGWARLQIKYIGGAAPPESAAAEDEYVLNGDTYGWFDDGWNGPGWYIVGYEFRYGLGFGGPEGWHDWHHHGVHAHVGLRDGDHEGGDHRDHDHHEGDRRAKDHDHHDGDHHGADHHAGDHHGGDHAGDHHAGDHHTGDHHGGASHGGTHHASGSHGGGTHKGSSHKGGGHPSKPKHH
jgi:hypothetical protein